MTAQSDIPEMATPAVAAAGSGQPAFYVLDEHEHAEGSTLLGFWIYLMSDALIFAVLFATFGVLSRRYAAGPSPADVFELPLIALNTAILLFSSITYGIAMVEVEKQRMVLVLFWLGLTGLYGLSFLGIEIYEFHHLVSEGAGPQRSAFLSAFFTLVGTHGLHVTAGIIWLVTLMVQLPMHGFTPDNRRRLMCLGMFWHFLDIIWIGVFTFVYLIGVLLS
jgi:cytochrome o ubiquinol oxidase subunit 3